MRLFLRQTSFATVIAVSLAGCGTSPPSISEAWEADYPGTKATSPPTPPISAGGQIEYEIKQNVYCELRHAVEDADTYFVDDDTAVKTRRSKLLPDDWGAQVSLSIQADENSALNPSVSFITPFTSATSRTVGLGATLSSAATRIDKFNSYYTIGYLRDKSKKTIHEICDGPKEDPFRKPPINIEPARSSFLTGDLGIRQWLLDALTVTQLIPSYGTPDAPKASPGRKSLAQPKSAKAAAPAASADTKGQDTVSIEIKFVVTTNGNVSPSWKLVRVAADTGPSPLLGAGRMRTHDLILTIGPRGTQSDNANLASQIGQAINSSRPTIVAPSILPF